MSNLNEGESLERIVLSGGCPAETTTTCRGCYYSNLNLCFRMQFLLHSHLIRDMLPVTKEMKKYTLTKATSMLNDILNKEILCS